MEPSHRGLLTGHTAAILKEVPAMVCDASRSSKSQENDKNVIAARGKAKARHTEMRGSQIWEYSGREPLLIHLLMPSPWASGNVCPSVCRSGTGDDRNSQDLCNVSNNGIIDTFHCLIQSYMRPQKDEDYEGRSMMNAISIFLSHTLHLL